MPANAPSFRTSLLIGALGSAIALAGACGGSSDGSNMPAQDAMAQQAALVEQGKQIFRFDTFGDERQWTDVLRMHEVISARSIR